MKAKASRDLPNGTVDPLLAMREELGAMLGGIRTQLGGLERLQHLRQSLKPNNVVHLSITPELLSRERLVDRPIKVGLMQWLGTIPQFSDQALGQVSRLELSIAGKTGPYVLAYGAYNDHNRYHRVELNGYRLEYSQDAGVLACLNARPGADASKIYEDFRRVVEELIEAWGLTGEIASAEIAQDSLSVQFNFKSEVSASQKIKISATVMSRAIYALLQEDDNRHNGVIAQLACYERMRHVEAPQEAANAAEVALLKAREAFRADSSSTLARETLEKAEIANAAAQEALKSAREKDLPLGSIKPRHSEYTELRVDFTQYLDRLLADRSILESSAESFAHESEIRSRLSHTTLVDRTAEALMKAGKVFRAGAKGITSEDWSAAYAAVFSIPSFGGHDPDSSFNRMHTASIALMDTLRALDPSARITDKVAAVRPDYEKALGFLKECKASLN